jgi:hypothetical protein
MTSPVKVKSPPASTACRLRRRSARSSRQVGIRTRCGGLGCLRCGPGGGRRGGLGSGVGCCPDRSNRTRPGGDCAQSTTPPASASTAQSHASRCTQARLGHPGQVRRLDRTSEGRGLTEPRVIDEDEQDVRRPLRRLDITHKPPVRRGVSKGPPTTPSERRVRDRKSGTVDAVLVSHQSAFPTRGPEVARWRLIPRQPACDRRPLPPSGMPSVPNRFSLPQPWLRYGELASPRTDDSDLEGVAFMTFRQPAAEAADGLMVGSRSASPTSSGPNFEGSRQGEYDLVCIGSPIRSNPRRGPAGSSGLSDG